MHGKDLIVLTDFEPDDRIAVEFLMAACRERIKFVGTSLFHAVRKKALVERVIRGIPVYAGTGGWPSLAARSTAAGRTYEMEGRGILTEAELDVFWRSEPSSDELGIALKKCLEEAPFRSMEIALLVAPTDLIKVIADRPVLRQKIRRIHAMGGWSIEQRTTYNFDMDAESSRRLMSLDDVPITLYSSHILKQQIGTTVNSQTFPSIIELLEKRKERSVGLRDAEKAILSWNSHVLKQIPALEAVVRPHIHQQFTPADLAVAVGVVAPEFVVRTERIRANITVQPDSELGSPVSVSLDPNSSVELAVELDKRVFEQTCQRVFSV